MQHLYLCVLLGEKVVHDNDCLCSTAMAVNALLNTWTDGDQLSQDVPFLLKKSGSRCLKMVDEVCKTNASQKCHFLLACA